MRRPWLVYGVVAIVCLGVGMAIAGVPTTESADPTIVVSETSSTTTVVTTTPEVVDTEPPATTTTTEPPATTTTQPPAITTTIPEPDLPDRADVAVVVANGAGVGGIAGETADTLQLIGYADVIPTDGTEVVDTSVVYYADGFEGSAVRMASDLELEPTAVSPIANAPEVIGDVADRELLVYVGFDQV